ncbi:hypothetical protein BpHYR1_028195 [Brachionus plicatilis]|uniref:Uncharacterized protein n=1 Tax=Brachionus plicatilis TaxID=10195 RepID=A0A3M7Q1G8_BRAPC|nr:hypothetical protein BpHYR1_028195 [Brachionus plicatilis]
MTLAMPYNEGVPPMSCKCQNKKVKARPTPMPMNHTTNKNASNFQLRSSGPALPQGWSVKALELSSNRPTENMAKAQPRLPNILCRPYKSDRDAPRYCRVHVSTRVIAGALKNSPAKMNIKNTKKTLLTSLLW